MAQERSTGLPDGPIATAPAEPERAAEVSVAFARAERAELEARDRPDTIIELAPNVTLGPRRVQAGEAPGGFLRNNPELQRANRKQIGFSLKF